jgi:SAM-dependent methyltransferase
MALDRWAAGDAYDAFMGRWSRALAAPFLESLSVPPGRRWLEVGCGTGALTAAILESQAPARLVACEPSAPLLEGARRALRDFRVAFHAAASGALPREPPGFDVVVSSLVLNFLPDPLAGLREMADCARPGGLIAAAVWDYGSGMEYLRTFWDAATGLEPQAAALDEGVRFPLCRLETLEDLFRRAGLTDVRCGAVTIETEFASFADYWQPLLGGTGPAPSYVATLRPPRRQALESRLRAELSSRGPAPWRLQARAWTVVGRVD